MAYSFGCQGISDRAGELILEAGIRVQNVVAPRLMA
jgi:hypothetical protein